MSMMIPNVGKIEMLKRVLYGNASAENGTLKLFSNNITPAETDVASTYTEANFTGYAAVTLTSSQSGGTWAVPTTSSNIGVSQYGTNALFTAGSDQTIYGWFVIGATSTLIWWSQAFTAGKALSGASSDTLTVIPKFQGTHI